MTLDQNTEMNQQRGVDCMADIIIIAVIAVVVGIAVAYIIREKKRGVKCIGCSSAGTCARRHSGAPGCSCGCSGEQK